MFKDKSDFDKCVHLIAKQVKKLPPVTSKEKTGHWIEDLSEYDDGYPKHIQAVWKCSECEQKQVRKSNYCPNCGVRMIEPHESEVNNE